MFILNKGLAGFFDGLVPVALKEKRHDDYVEYIRIRALSAMLIIMLLLSIPGFISAFIDTLPSTGFLLADWSGVIVLCAFALQAALFYKFNNYWLSALAFSSTYFLTIVIFVVMSGGHESPMKMLMLTCPFVSFMISGKHEGFQTSALVAIIGISLAFIQSIGFESPDMFAGANDHFIFSVDWIIAVIIIIFSLMVYESALQENEKLKVNSAMHHASAPVKGAIDRYFHLLISPVLRDTLPANSMIYMRARFLAALLMTLAVLGVFTTIPMLFGFWLLEEDPSRMAFQNLVIFAVLLLFIFQAWLFYRFGNQEFSSLLFANSYFLVVLAMVVSSGGYDSLLKYFLLTCPLVAFVVGGMREGVQNAIFTMIAGLVLAWLKIRGTDLPDIFTGGIYPYVVFGSNWLVTVGVIVTCIAVYETGLQT